MNQLEQNWRHEALGRAPAQPSVSAGKTRFYFLCKKIVHSQHTYVNCYVCQMWVYKAFDLGGCAPCLFVLL